VANKLLVVFDIVQLRRGRATRESTSVKSSD